MPHTQECKNSQEKYKKLLAEYEKQWPLYCRKCSGRGEFTFVNGAGFWPMEVSEPCKNCMIELKCPRCSNHFTEDQFDNMQPCICGWNWGRNESDYAPQEPECDCWYEESMGRL